MLLCLNCCRIRLIKMMGSAETVFLRVLTALRRQCDETKPECKNCTRRSTPCHFPDSDGSPGLRGRNSAVLRPSPSLEGAAASHSRAPSPSRSPAPEFSGSASLRTSSAHPATISHVSESTQSSQYAFDLLDLELWNHYLSSVALTLTDHPEGLPLWRDRIPKIAHTTSYAAQLLLAFSALNLYRNGDPRSNALLQKSASLQSAAINGMMVALNEDRPGNAGALWVAAMMLCFCSFGRGPQRGQYLVGLVHHILQNDVCADRVIGLQRRCRARMVGLAPRSQIHLDAQPRRHRLRASQHAERGGRI